MDDLLIVIKGYLEIKVTGYSAERFMNLCRNHGILLWGILKDRKGYRMNISLEDFRCIRPIAKKTRTKVVISQRYGLPFLLAKLKKRYLFVSCFLVLSGCLFLSMSVVWNIEYRGNKSVTDDRIGKFLKTQNVYEGQFFYRIDIEKTEKKIREQFDEIIWVSIKKNGTKLDVDIKENEHPLNSISGTERKESKKDIVSPYDGMIDSIVVAKGVPCVKPGQEVKKGDILVSGSYPIYEEDGLVKEYQSTDCKADITIKHNITFRKSLSSVHRKKRYTGRTKKQIYIRVVKNCYKWKDKNSYKTSDVFVNERRGKLFEKLNIPVFIGVILEKEYMEEESVYTRAEATAILEKEYNTFLSILSEKGVQIIEKDGKIEFDGKEWLLVYEFLVCEQL